MARQYVTQFATVLDEVVPALRDGCDRGWPLAEAIVHTQIQLLSRHGDSLIARKCGVEVSREAAARAAQVLDCGVPADEDYQTALAELDFWLRCDQHRRNPGTTADLIAAGLFVMLRDGELVRLISHGDQNAREKRTVNRTGEVETYVRVVSGADPERVPRLQCGPLHHV